MHTTGIGVIGCGGMGMAIVNKVLALDTGLQVRGLYDPDPRSIQNAQQQITPAPRVYDDYRQLVAAYDIRF